MLILNFVFESILLFVENLSWKLYTKISNKFKLCVKILEYIDLLRMIYREEILKVLYVWMCLGKDVVVY